MTMIPARARTCITSSGVQHTSHKATVPPTCTLHWVVSLKQKKNHLSFSLSLFSCLALFAWGINWPTLVQKILLKALNQHIRYSKHYNGADKITLLFFFSFAVDPVVYVTQNWLLFHTCPNLGFLWMCTTFGPAFTAQEHLFIKTLW